MTISFHTNGRFSKAEDKMLDLVFIGICEYSCCCERLDLISTDKSFAIAFVPYPSTHYITKRYTTVSKRARPNTGLLMNFALLWNGSQFMEM